MATAAPTTALPLLYNGIVPLSSNDHSNARIRRLNGIPQLAQTHAVPVTVDEFALVQRHFPIIFSAGDDPVPLALMGLNEGVNVFIDDEGKVTITLGTQQFFWLHVGDVPAAPAPPVGGAS